MKISKLDLQDLSKNISSTQISEETAISTQETGFIPFGRNDELENPEYTKSQLEATVNEAYQKGLNEGKQIGIQETNQNVLSVEQSSEQKIQRILTSLTAALNEFEQHKVNLKQDMGKLTHHIIKKILKEKIDENFENMILESFEKILPIISQEPKISIIMETTTMAQTQNKIEKIIASNNFTGEIDFIPNPNLSKEDCRVEWNKNGINFDLNEKIKEIDEIIIEYIKSI